MLRHIRQGGWCWPATIALLCLLCFTSSAPAQKTGARGATSLDTAGRRQIEAAAPKVEANVRVALREAERLNATSATKAIERLQRALDQIENDASLSEKRQDALKRMLKDRIRVMQAPAPTEESLKKQIEKTKRPAEEDQALSDQVRVLRLQEGIRKLLKDARPAGSAG